MGFFLGTTPSASRLYQGPRFAWALRDASCRASPLVGRDVVFRIASERNPSAGSGGDPTGSRRDTHGKTGRRLVAYQRYKYDGPILSVPALSWMNGGVGGKDSFWRWRVRDMFPAKLTDNELSSKRLVGKNLRDSPRSLWSFGGCSGNCGQGRGRQTSTLGPDGFHTIGRENRGVMTTLPPQ